MINPERVLIKSEQLQEIIASTNDSYINMLGPPPPNTIDNIAAQLQEFCDKLYANYSGKPEILISKNDVTLYDDNSWVKVSLIPNPIHCNKYGCLIELRVEGSNITVHSTKSDYQLIGEFAGYQEACKKAFVHWMGQKVDDVWVDSF
jgi:hypothetical protein